VISLDTTVVAKLFFDEDRADIARMLFAEAVRSNEPIIASPLLPCEFVSVVRRKMRREGVSLAEASAILDDMLALPIDIQNDPELFHLALRLTERYSLSAFDAQFVALSEIAGCDLWLDDERVLTAIAGRLPRIRRLADYSSAR
jgi:predicted nucleic acid-binding protein